MATNDIPIRPDHPALMNSFVRLAILVSLVLSGGCRAFDRNPCDACWANETASNVAAEPLDPEPGSAGNNTTAKSVEPDRAVTAQYVQHADADTGNQFAATNESDDSQNLALLPQADGNLAVGSQLSSTPTLASEIALRLKDENARMKAAGRKLLSQVSQLREDLTQRNALLEKTASAMATARNELVIAEKTNSDLKKRVMDLEIQKRELQAATDRMLRLIRSELDDALMNEIVLAGE